VIIAPDLTGERTTTILVFAGDEDSRPFANSRFSGGGGYPGRTGDQPDLILQPFSHPFSHH
jgi:hypothetical protein